MLVLALDTSAYISVSLVMAGAGSSIGGSQEEPPESPRAELRILAERRATEQRRHAELLAPMITAVLADAGADRRDLSAVVVGTGPAPFTGLRAGLVTARTLAFALSIPCHGVCSLDAIAAEAFDRSLATADVLVATDARRRELYVARYRRPSGTPEGTGTSTVTPAGTPEGTGTSTGTPDGRRVIDEVELVAGPAVMRPHDLAAEGWTTGTVVGAGALLYPAHLAVAAGAPMTPDPAVLARLALHRAARSVEQGTEPLYLRRPDVTPSATRKRATDATPWATRKEATGATPSATTRTGATG